MALTVVSDDVDLQRLGVEVMRLVFLFSLVMLGLKETPPQLRQGQDRRVTLGHGRGGNAQFSHKLPFYVLDVHSFLCLLLFFLVRCIMMFYCILCYIFCCIRSRGSNSECSTCT